MKGYIHSLESLAAVDGDGLRYAVFLSGCPLSCIYCHNPDTQCKGGWEMSCEELVKKIARYKTYFKNGGGVTFSGGEPLLQAEFIVSTAELLRKVGIGYVIDTSGAVAHTEYVRRALEGADQILLDLKFYTDADYKRYTGASLSSVLRTLELLNSLGKNVTLKTVIVPGINDTPADIEEYARIANNYSCVQKYELLPFHTMGFFKYEKLGLQNKLKNTAAMPRPECDALQKRLDDLRHKR